MKFFYWFSGILPGGAKENAVFFRQNGHLL
jgi:hypothetical protein